MKQGIGPLPMKQKGPTANLKAVPANTDVFISVWLLVVQVGLVKRYADAEAVAGLLSLVKLELGMSLDTEFTQACCPALPCLALARPAPPAPPCPTLLHPALPYHALPHAAPML